LRELRGVRRRAHVAAHPRAGGRRHGRRRPGLLPARVRLGRGDDEVRPAAVSRTGVKLAFVIQRYGLEVAGGSEMHCRWLAQRLARHHDVRVLTTCALDYLEWNNHYPAGEALVEGIR